jgi:hypothetical protein
MADRYPVLEEPPAVNILKASWIKKKSTFWDITPCSKLKVY